MKNNKNITLNKKLIQRKVIRNSNSKTMRRNKIKNNNKKNVNKNKYKGGDIIKKDITEIFGHRQNIPLDNIKESEDISDII